MLLIILGIALSLLGCQHQLSSPHTPPLNYLQFGDKIYFKGPDLSACQQGRKLIQFPEGCWIVPDKSFLKPVPAIKPHLKIVKVNSAEITLQVLSLFPKIALFLWENNTPLPPISALQEVSPGIIRLKNIKPGKTYFISGAVKYKPKLFGPLSPPLKVTIKDTTPPLPCPAVAYVIKNNKVQLLWQASASPDVKGYYLLWNNKKQFVKCKEKFCQTEIELNFSGRKEIKIIAVDYAGNKSKAQKIWIKQLNKEKGE